MSVCVCVSSLALSRVISDQSVESNFQVDRGEAAAFRKLFGYISRTVSKSFDFISELYSAQFLHDELFESYMNKSAKLRDSGKEWSEQNSEVLWEVRKKISQNPDMFDEFCNVLERLNYNQCSEKLKSKHTTILGTYGNA